MKLGQGELVYVGNSSKSRIQRMNGIVIQIIYWHTNLSLSFIPCVFSSLFQKYYLSWEGSQAIGVPQALESLCSSLEAEDSEMSPLPVFHESLNSSNRLSQSPGITEKSGWFRGS